MQTFKNDELMKTQMGSIENLAKEIVQDVKKKEKKKVPDRIHHVVGKIPKAGREFTLDGLLYRIVSSNPLRGIFIAKIKEPK